MPKKTIGDAVKNIYNNYIAPTKEDSKAESKELDLLDGLTRYSSRNKAITKPYSLTEMRKISRQVPLFDRAAWKQADDSTRAWFHFENWDDGSELPEEASDIIKKFNIRTNFQSKWKLARANSAIYGNSYFIVSFTDDSAKDLSKAPPSDAIPYNPRLINSEFITELNYYPKREKYYRAKHIMHFHYVDSSENKDEWIHPDRIIHMPCDPLPYNKLGSSKINLLRNLIESNINIDIATGEILAWFAHGLLDVKQQGCKEAHIKKWNQVYSEHPGIYVHGDDSEIKFQNPEAIDPKPFYDYLILNIAAAFRMPTHVLTGIQIGRVTGSEIGFGDYYKDLKAIQDLSYNPPLTRFYKMLIERTYKARGKSFDWKYLPVWNTIYIDETAEVDIVMKKSIAIQKLADTGIFTKEELRKIFNKGQIQVDVK